MSSINLHASLVADLLLYNFDWLFNVLSNGIYEERFIESLDVIRYNFEIEDIEKLYIWTNDTKNSLNKIKKIKSLGFKDIEIINSMNFHEQIYEPEKDKNFKILQRFINNSKKEKMTASYGPIFINYYTDLNWHKGQFSYMWSRIKDVCNNRIYIDFNLNSNYLNSKRLSGSSISAKDKEEFIDFVKSIVGEKVEVLEKPNFFSLNPKTDFDLGDVNFCFSRSYLNPGITNIYEQNAKESMHFTNSFSLILNERPGEDIIERRLVEGKFHETFKEEKNKKNEREKVLNNVESFFNFI